ncbi:hypothetical protein CPLU01_07867 [Colletotrichum plurivorum]|uniref:Ankyrin repeat protein n=1 Tax=Colletotrichum plurivorum TaxID=2175906 RepID=A0A8H6KEJ9_9PEZI|nr:hypothetical protein CPLU01_07867 [Colletotrichum plurivorum]
MKVEMLKFRIDNVQKIGNDLSSVVTDDLLPEIHRDILLNQLQQYLQLLTSINSAYPGVRGQTRGIKMQWSLFDKSKSGRVMRDLKDVNETLDQVLTIVSLLMADLLEYSVEQPVTPSLPIVPVGVLTAYRRLATFQQSSLLALRVSSAAMLPALELQTRELQSSIDAAAERQTVLLEQTRTASTRCSEFKLGMQHSPDTHQKNFTRFELSTAGSKSPYSASEKTNNNDHDYVDNLMTSYDSGLGTLSSSSWTFGSTPFAAKDDPRHAGRLTLDYNKYHRNLRVSLRVKFYFLNERVLSFELGLRQFIRAWASIATTDCRISVANIRPTGSPIFELCRKSDLEGVRKVLEEGQASIYDVDDLDHATLLDGGIRQPWIDPAIICALEYGLTETVRLMLRYGMEFDTDKSGLPLLYHINHRTLTTFQEQLALMSSLGFVHPNCNRSQDRISPSHVLCGAICLGSVPDVLFSIEVLEVDMKNLVPQHKEVYLHKLAASAREVKTAAILHEYGLTTHLLEGKAGGFHYLGSPSTDLSHWYLFNNTIRNAAPEDIEIRTSHNVKSSPWAWFWLNYQNSFDFEYRSPTHDGSTWRFGPSVIIAAHLLLHGASWSHLLTYVRSNWDPWYEELTQQTYEFTALDIAKAWGNASAHPLTEREGTESAEKLEEICVDEADFHISWSNNGTITRDRCGNERFRNDSRVSGRDPGETGTENENPSSCHICSKSTHSQKNAISEADAAPGDEQNTLPTDALFAAAISTPQGRRQMQRYPLVKALSYALQLAGYRVEMDDEGDLWFEDDDGDPYSDAVEHVQDLDKAGPLGGTCPICRDPEAYGLGHGLDRAEDGLAEWRKERQKFVDRGALRDDGWVWPSWTRRGGRR